MSPPEPSIGDPAFVERLAQRLAALETSRDSIFADEAAGRISPADARSARRDLQARADALEAQIASLEKRTPQYQQTDTNAGPRRRDRLQSPER